MKENINDYAFVDCLLVSFETDKTLTHIQIVVEAFFPAFDAMQRQKGLLRISFSGIIELNIIKSEEFDFDINQSYSFEQEDVRANEVYEIKVESSLVSTKVKFKSDMLQFNMECKKIDIIKI